MNDSPRDIEYYEAETAAAREGQTAAMEFARTKSKEATAYKLTADYYTEKANALEKKVLKLEVIAHFWFLVALFLIALIIWWMIF